MNNEITKTYIIAYNDQLLDNETKSIRRYIYFYPITKQLDEINKLINNAKSINSINALQNLKHEIELNPLQLINMTNMKNASFNCKLIKLKCNIDLDFGIFKHIVSYFHYLHSQ